MIRCILSATCALLLCGCTPSFQQKLQKEQADEGAYNMQAREHAAAERCGAMVPGSTEHMTCMLSASKPRP
jgi:hypothetical protein